MSRFVSVGYRQPQPTRVCCGEMVVSAGGLRATNRQVPSWHYLTDVSVEWPVSVDLHGVQQDCGLSGDAQIGISLSWRSDRTNLRAANPVIAVADGENMLRAVIPGPTLGGTLTIEVSLVLRRTDAAADRFAPSRPGTLLWRHSESFALEGAGGRFPTSITNFTTEGFPGGTAGLWYLEIIDTDLQASCTAALMLYLNSSHPSVQEMLGETESTHNTPLMQFMLYDVYRQLMGVAYRDEEFDDRASYDKGSFGDILITLLRLFFPGRDITQLRRDFALNPTEVEAELLAATWRPGQ
jgi:hypothetical protein